MRNSAAETIGENCKNKHGSWKNDDIPHITDIIPDSVIYNMEMS